jgi:hypothetical protein
VVLVHLFAQWQQSLKVKLNTLLAMLASTAVLAKLFAQYPLSPLNNFELTKKAPYEGLFLLLLKRGYRIINK